MIISAHAQIGAFDPIAAERRSAKEYEDDDGQVRSNREPLSREMLTGAKGMKSAVA